MQLKDVRIFMTAAGTQNLRAAADVLGVTQPAISKAIARLEASLGGKVFERTARGVALTRIGEVLLERGKALRAIVSDIETEIGDISAGNAGLVRLGTVPLALESVIARVLSRQVSSRTALRFDVRVQLSSELLRLLEAGTLDLAIAAMPSKRVPELTSVVLYTSRSYVVACRSHPIHARPFTLADLAREQWLLPPPDVALCQWIAGEFQAVGLTLPPYTVQSDASPLMFKALVRNTGLLTVMTEEMLGQGVDTDLVQLPAPAPQRRVQIGLFWRRKAFFSMPMQRCRAQIRTAFTQSKPEVGRYIDAA